jgi:hypothetical protein
MTATDSESSTSGVATSLLDFNQQVLDQALTLLGYFGATGESAKPMLGGPVGAHLRHVVEHYAALVFPAEVGVVDYDARPRERALESDPQLASSRLRALRQQLAIWPSALLGTPVRVRGQGGLLGDRRFEVSSTLGRELAFVASHAIHHFAVLAAYGRAQGITLPQDFGKAPSTVAHERASAVAPDPLKAPIDPSAIKGTPCTASPQPA